MGNSGEALERDFAKWLKRALGYNSTELRQQVKGKVADRPYEVDIRAEKFSEWWDRIKVAGLLLFALALFIYLFPNDMPWATALLAQGASALDPRLPAVAPLALGILALGVAYVGKHKATTIAWVECKDHKKNVKRADVLKLQSSVEDVRNNDSPKWTPSVVMLVSGSNFDQDALNFGREHEFHLYVRDGAGFKRVD